MGAEARADDGAIGEEETGLNATYIWAEADMTDVSDGPFDRLHMDRLI